MDEMDRLEQDVLVLGGGLAGLSAGYALTKAGVRARVLEKDSQVGGLAKTVAHGRYRFDLGGHRFAAQEKGVEALVTALLGDGISRVGRKSQILLNGRFIDYPLGFPNAVRGLGVSTTLQVASDLALGRLRSKAPHGPVSLEDWVVARFGRSLFEIYFKDYSEKLWGIPCQEISAAWVEKRIEGLSPWVVVRDALFHGRGKTPRTLDREFLYPSGGVGRIAERLREEIDRENRVMCGVQVRGLLHEGFRVKGAVACRGPQTLFLDGRAVISTIPIADLVMMLEPPAPADVLQAAAQLRFRDLVVVSIMLNMERATDQSWIYIPEPGIPFGRIHEPANWSRTMAPPGKTHLVAEWFCFEGDEVWRATDWQLGRQTISHLARLGFIKERDVADFAVTRVPKAYPLFRVGYEVHEKKAMDYLGRFENLFMAGRGGLFRYFNMDHAMASGREAATKAMEGTLQMPGGDEEDSIAAEQGA